MLRLPANRFPTWQRKLAVNAIVGLDLKKLLFQFPTTRQVKQEAETC